VQNGLLFLCKLYDADLGSRNRIISRRNRNAAIRRPSMCRMIPW
jgi:hypothetical protein